jgi:hypothetical protein
MPTPDDSYTNLINSHYNCFIFPHSFLSNREIRLAKQKVNRGTRKRFEVFITDLNGNGQDPDAGSCKLTFVKSGEYGYDSPRGPFDCKKTGDTGYWGNDFFMSPSMTIGDWVARYTWTVAGVPDAEDFEFTIGDADRPYISRTPLAPNVKVVG